MSEIYSAIADPTRRQILSALAGKPATVSDLVALTGAEQPTVSKHLKTLRDANLVTVEAQGQARVYALNAAPLAEVANFVQSLGMGTESTTDELQELLGDAGEKLGGWLSAGATWLNSQVQEQLSKVDVDTVKLGRELGRKLADAKAAATEVAVEVEAGIREDAENIKAKVASTVSKATAKATSVPKAQNEQPTAAKSAATAEPDEDEF
ncbi:MAG: ArsR/SmtB family transcription factor [Micrococcales bacterium]